MNLEKLNHWLSLIANFGVLIGVVFLAIKMRQLTLAVVMGARCLATAIANVAT